MKVFQYPHHITFYFRGKVNKVFGLLLVIFSDSPLAKPLACQNVKPEIQSGTDDVVTFFLKCFITGCVLGRGENHQLLSSSPSSSSFTYRLLLLLLPLFFFLLVLRALKLLCLLAFFAFFILGLIGFGLSHWRDRSRRRRICCLSPLSLSIVCPQMFHF